MEKVKLIQGNLARAEEVQKTLEEWGLVNSNGFLFRQDEAYYYLDQLSICNCIDEEVAKELISKGKAEIYELPPLKPKCEFKPFERVLVRDEGWQKWMPSLFGKYDENAKECPYYTMSGYHSQCIKYEGNEALLGTTDNPK